MGIDPCLGYGKVMTKGVAFLVVTTIKGPWEDADPTQEVL